jgi:hypothetical protein
MFDVFARLNESNWPYGLLMTSRVHQRLRAGNWSPLTLRIRAVSRPPVNGANRLQEWIAFSHRDQLNRSGTFHPPNHGPVAAGFLTDLLEMRIDGVESHVPRSCVSSSFRHCTTLAPSLGICGGLNTSCTPGCSCVAPERTGRTTRRRLAANVSLEADQGGKDAINAGMPLIGDGKVGRASVYGKIAERPTALSAAPKQSRATASVTKKGRQCEFRHRSAKADIAALAHDTSVRMKQRDAIGQPLIASQMLAAIGTAPLRRRAMPQARDSAGVTTHQRDSSLLST